MKPPTVSVAIALLDEEDVLPELLQRVGAVLDALPGGPHELVLVDDGSSDTTFDQIAEAARRDPRILGLSLSRNFGHQPALSAALDHVSGDVVILMDGDLQDPPEEIPRLLEVSALGYDVVYARRIQRKEGWFLRLSYFVFYRMIAVLATVRLPVDSGDFALLSKPVVDALKAMPEQHRYLRGLRTWVGFRQIGIDVERSPRTAGKPGYTPTKLVRLALDGIFAFSTAPLRAASVVGIAATLGASLFAMYSIWVRLTTGESPKGFTALIIVITFFSGVQLLFLGVIGEYLGRVYDETKRRPPYVIARSTRVGVDGR